LPLLGSKWFKPLRLILACFVVPWLLLRFRIRTVQLNGYFESLLLAPLRVLGCKTIYTMHGPFETENYSCLTNPARFLPRFLSKHSLRFASQVVCVSETVGDLAAKVLPAHKIKVIPNWVEPPRQFRREFSLAARPRLLFVGRLEDYKGVQFILEAMRQIPELTLVVVGEGAYRPRLEAMARNLDVHFAGFQQDVSRFYEECTLFVNPSLGPEGLPLVSLEAMAYGLPCVFSDLPVHCEISNNGQAAALFRKGDCVSLVRQLRLLLADEALRQNYGLAARMGVEQNYCLRQATRRYLEVFGYPGVDGNSSAVWAARFSNHQIALADD
jgi:glycosyltransferase involved in cell wall biosynthesis